MKETTKEISDFMNSNNQNDSAKRSQGSTEQSYAPNKAFGKFISYFLVVFVVLVGGYIVINHFFYRSIDCTVVSAQATSGGGGIKAAGSWQGVNVETQECGLVLFVRMQNEGFSTSQDLADELNRHRGEKLRFHAKYMDFGKNEVTAVELEGHPIRK